MKKKALLVGINAYPTSPLNGCVNDVLLMNQIITEKFGFTQPAHKRMLVDQSATTSNIIDRLEWLVEGAEPGDVLFFHYSGHGSQMVDTDYNLEEEPDGLDEIICPIDLDWRGNVVKDDDLARIFKRIPEGVNLTVLLDCCHSGQGLRNLETGPNKNRFLPAPVDILNRAYGLDLSPKPRGIRTGDIQTDEKIGGVLLSGCKSHQTSADAWIQVTGKYMGAFTFYLSQTLEKFNWQIPHNQLIKEVNKKLKKAGYEQQPELNCSEKLIKHKFLDPLI